MGGGASVWRVGRTAEDQEVYISMFHQGNNIQYIIIQYLVPALGDHRRERPPVDTFQR